MTLRQFEAFLAVARARSFRRAAETLHLSQPALSQHVRELEGALGARLFDRLGRAVHLTERPAGSLEDHATRLFVTLTDARHAIADLQGLQRGTLAIGASTTPGIYVVPGVLGRFPGSATPRSRWPCSSGTPRRSRRWCGRASSTSGWSATARRVRPKRAWRPAWRMSSCSSSARRMRGPAAVTSVRPQLAGQPLLLREPGSATRRVTERALAGAGVAYRQGMVLPHTEAIKQGVLAGLER